MLTEEQLVQIKEEFIDLVNHINYKYDEELTDEENLERLSKNNIELINFLESTDFFTAPASTQYHCAFEGGLCLHSLNVYYKLSEMWRTYKDVNFLDITMDDVLIVSLFHELDKTNYYELYYQNQKMYSETGSKYDSMGKFDWIQVPKYKVKDVKDRVTLGDSGFSAYMLLKNYLQLTDLQIMTIVNYNCMNEDGTAKKNQLAILDNNPLATLLHCADLICTYIEEKNFKVETEEDRDE